MRFRFAILVLAAAMTSTFTGCNQDVITQLDTDGDGTVSRTELITGLMNYFCSDGPAPTTPTDGTSAGTTTGN